MSISYPITESVVVTTVLGMVADFVHITNDIRHKISNFVKVHWMQLKYVASAVAGTRKLAIEIRGAPIIPGEPDSGRLIWRRLPSDDVTIPANATMDIRTGTTPTVNITNYSIQIPLPRIFVPDGGYVRVFDAAEIDPAGDVLSGRIAVGDHGVVSFIKEMTDDG